MAVVPYALKRITDRTFEQIGNMDTQLKEIIEKREDTLARLKRVFIEDLNLQLEPDEIDPDAALFGSGLDLDSIDAVEIATAVELSFQIRLKNIAQRNSFRTLNTLVDVILLAEKKREKNSA